MTARRALVIASETHGLRGCNNDAELIASLLAERGFDTRPIRGGEATRKGILGAYEDLIAATGPNDAVVVFYAGHGSRDTTVVDGAPKELRFIMPMDIGDTTAEDFRGILTEELSILQWRLTLRTPNVTTILDCCYSSRMSRGDPVDGARIRGWEAKWPASAVTRRWAAAGAEFRRLRDDHPDSGWFDANPLAVRLVACGSHERAREGYFRDLGRVHGYFTASLVPILTADPLATWRTVADRARQSVLSLNPAQRPEGEGPTNRVVFTTDERRNSQTYAVRKDRLTGQAWLDGARLHGIRPDDQFLLTPMGLSPGPEAPILRATHLVGDAALLDTEDDEPIPDGSVAHAWRSAGHDPVVLIEADATPAALAGISGIRLATEGTGIATVTIRDGRFMLYDANGAPLYRADRPADAAGIAALRQHLEDLAVSLRLRSLDPTDRLDAAIDFRVSAGAGRTPVADGTILHLTDRLWVTVANAGPTRVYANVLDLGVAGRVEVMNQAEPAGITLDAGEKRALAEEPGGHDPGMTFMWPSGVPADAARYETLVAVFSHIPQDLRGLSREGVRGEPRRGDLDRLLNAGTREVGRGPAYARYTIRRVTFALCPGGRACEHRDAHK
ncbi:caspase family protein [Salinispora arenicola]|uniref:caspase family protein n=1 Tax=Salinispora arenicola TaxID=168697 RepID=UPI0003A7C15C|nr:caspase family protein [Salinispora arenicola]